MVELERLGRAVGVLDPALHRLAGAHGGEADEAQPIVLADAVVVRGILEGQGHEPLLLEIRLVDPREAPGDDGGAAEQPGGQRRVLAARALTVVVIAHDHPLHTLGPVVARDLGDRL